MKSAVAVGKSVVYYAPKDVRIEEMAEVPEIGEGELLVRVEACAICGTDIKSFFKGNPRIKPPMTMGHEFCGTIERADAAVSGYRVGQRVTMATTIGCGDCFYCRQGKSNLCRDAEAIGFHYPGAMAPYLRIPAKAVARGHLVDVGDMDASVASLSEPLSCALNGLGRLPMDQIKNVLVLGLGPLGLLHTIAVRAKGAERVVCVEFPGKRLDLAKRMDFVTGVTPDRIDEQYKDLSGGEGFDLVVVTAPHNPTQAKAPMYARKAGYVSFFASLPVGDEMLSVNSRTIHYNELVIFGTSDSTPVHTREAVRLLQKDTKLFSSLITHQLPMSDFHIAMDEIAAQNAVKVVLSP
ncbi:MAG TPA: alcohol dehydrogenase catalytic domain-containing protein [Spirochaetia bacterium]|nr:alcohol dehydrogenase catalytic domain-containing protein [Spirochaetia bacterium]